MKTVYFFQRPDHRERQKDTVRNAPKDVQVLTSLPETRTDSILVNQAQQQSFKGKIKNFIIKYILPYTPLLNMRRVPKAHIQADYVYTWSILPLGCKKPYAVELENVYAVTFYYKNAFRFYKPYIRRKFLSNQCKKVVCISEACKQSLIHELGPAIKNKIVVLPPRMEAHYTKRTAHTTINFLFVGTLFRLKGGPELLRAFHETKNPRARLTIVGFKDDHYTQLYKNDKRITFLGKVLREKILTELYPASDVLVFPSFYESQGTSSLEALSYGLGLIVTNVYAMPEVVRDGKNGVLLKHPYIKPVHYGKHSFVDVTQMTIGEFQEKYLDKEELNENMYKQLKAALERACKEHKQWKKESVKLYEEQFSVHVWEERFHEIFN